MRRAAARLTRAAARTTRLNRPGRRPTGRLLAGSLRRGAPRRRAATLLHAHAQPRLCSSQPSKRAARAALLTPALPLPLPAPLCAGPTCFDCKATNCLQCTSKSFDTTTNRWNITVTAAGCKGGAPVSWICCRDAASGCQMQQGNCLTSSGSITYTTTNEEKCTNVVNATFTNITISDSSPFVTLQMHDGAEALDREGRARAGGVETGQRRSRVQVEDQQQPCRGRQQPAAPSPCSAPLYIPPTRTHPTSRPFISPCHHPPNRQSSWQHLMRCYEPLLQWLWRQCVQWPARLSVHRLREKNLPQHMPLLRPRDGPQLLQPGQGWQLLPQWQHRGLNRNLLRRQPGGHRHWALHSKRRGGKAVGLLLRQAGSGQSACWEGLL